jgi:hypothetical protein
MAKTIKNNHAARAFIARREAFQNRRVTFSADEFTPGQTWPNPLRYVGYLPKGFHESLSRADYVVYSYFTPIGWHVPDHGWVIPEVTYSATTSSHHAPQLRAAVTPVLPRSWSVTGGSPTAAAILRSIRAGYTVNAKGRTRRVLDLVLATGEAVRDGDNLTPKAV